MWLFFRPVCGNAGIDGFVITPFVSTHNHIVRLGIIECLNHCIYYFAPGAFHGMPPIDGDWLCQCLTGKKYHCHSNYTNN